MRKKILVVCSGNTCRSPMAEALIRKKAKDKSGLDLDISSAGIYALDGEPASIDAINALAEYNIDISNHRSRLLTPKILKDSNIVLTMTYNQKRAIQLAYPELTDRVFTLMEYIGEDGDIIDPFGQGSNVYKATARQIYDAAEKIIDRLN